MFVKIGRGIKLICMFWRGLLGVSLDFHQEYFALFSTPTDNRASMNEMCFVEFAVGESKPVHERLKRTQRLSRRSWSMLDRLCCSNRWDCNCFHPAVPCQMLWTWKSTLASLWRFSKSYTFLYATTDCNLTRDRILFEYENAKDHSLPVPPLTTHKWIPVTSMICKTSMVKNKQTICGGTRLSAAI